MNGGLRAVRSQPQASIVDPEPRQPRQNIPRIDDAGISGFQRCTAASRTTGAILLKINGREETLIAGSRFDKKLRAKTEP
jgi:hypothetical protein